MIAALETQLDTLIAKYNEQGRDSSAPVPEWILPPLSCQFVEDIAKLLPPDSHAFEFGSGRSTHALRSAFSGLFTLEHSAEWLERTESFTRAPRDASKLDCLKQSSLTSEFVAKRSKDDTFAVSLTRCWNRLRLIESFNLAKHPDILARLKQARFILVDSPPNPAKREHALFLALHHAPVGAVIVLDDLEIRATVRFAQRLARQNLKRFRFWRLHIDHQLGIFLKLRAGRIRSRPGLIEFVGTWLRA
jgi:hypothetical protein